MRPCLSAPLIKVMRVYVIHTCPKADDCAEAVSTSLHDDRGKDFPTQKAVLNASSECIETLVTQHGKLVVHCATWHWQLYHTQTNCDKMYHKLHFTELINYIYLWDDGYLCRELPGTRRLFCLSYQHSESCIGCFLLALLFIAGTHGRKPATSQLSLIGKAMRQR